MPAAPGRRTVFLLNLRPSAVNSDYTQVSYIENVSPEGRNFSPGIYSLKKQRFSGQERRRTR